MKRRRMLITVEEERVIEIRAPGRPNVRCDCGADGLMLTPEAAAASTKLTSRAIYRLVEDGSLHFKETPSGLLLVCIASLSRWWK